MNRALPHTLHRIPPLLLAFVAIASLFASTSARAQLSPGIVISTSQGVATVSIAGLDAGSQFNGFDITLSFDASSAAATGVTAAGSWNTSLVPPVIDNAAGTIHVVGISLSPSCGTGCALFTVTFTPKGGATFVPVSVGASQLATSSGQALPPPTGSAGGDVPLAGGSTPTATPTTPPATPTATPTTPATATATPAQPTSTSTAVPTGTAVTPSATATATSTIAPGTPTNPATTATPGASPTGTATPPTPIGGSPSPVVPGSPSPAVPGTSTAGPSSPASPAGTTPPALGTVTEGIGAVGSATPRPPSTGTGNIVTDPPVALLAVIAVGVLLGPPGALFVQRRRTGR